MKFLLDENLCFYGLSFVKSVEVLGEGATDSMVFEYARKNDMIVVTKDKRFALDMIISGSKTVYVDSEFNGVFVDPVVI